MLRMKSNPKIVILLALAGAVAGIALDGCTSQPAPTTQSDTATAEPAFALFGPPPKRSGVELWSDNCARCHNSRPLNEFSGAQWSVIVHHMRLRANLSGEESREIIKFLQASS